MRMIPLRFASLTVVVLAALTFTACPGDDGPTADAGPDPTGCTIDRECGTGSICDKTDDGDDIPAADDPEGVCLRVTCQSDADCAEDEKCDPRRGICVPKNLCDPGDPDACSTDGDLCQYVDGRPACAPAPTPDSCSLTPAVAYVAAGGTLQFEGVGIGAGGVLVPHTTFTFAATGGTFAGGTFTAPAAAGDVTVTGTTAKGSKTCTSTVKVYAPLGAADARIVVIDQGARTPIVGAKVAARVGAANVEGVTGADGSFTFVGGAAATSMSAFPDGFQWHTLVDPPTDAVVYTAKVQATPVVDGVKGTFDFSDVTTRGDIKLGLAGAAINAAITDLNFSTIIGEFVDTSIEISGITPEGGQVVGLPEGLVIGLGAEDFKANYVALSDKKGPSVAWALAGRVQLAKVGPIITSVTGSADLDFGAILGAVLPFFASFDHAVVTGLDFDPAVRAAGDANFETVVIKPNTLMTQEAEYNMPNLPCAPGGFGTTGCTNDLFLLTTGAGEAAVKTVVNVCPALTGTDTCVPSAPFTSGAVVLSGVIVPGQGLVPLGLSAALDIAKKDQVADGIAEQSGDGVPAAGKLRMDYAPPHDGLEGNLYVTVAIALDINQVSASKGLGASIITQVSRSLPTTGNSFAGNSFLQSQGGVFAAGAAGGFTLAKKGDADFYRVNLDDNAAQEWNVWFPGTATGFQIAELAQHSGVTVAPRTVHADVQAFNLDAGYDGAQPANFDELFAFDGRDIDNLLYYLGGWSSESCKVGGICDIGGGA